MVLKANALVGVIEMDSVDDLSGNQATNSSQRQKRRLDAWTAAK